MGRAQAALQEAGRRAAAFDVHSDSRAGRDREGAVQEHLQELAHAEAGFNRAKRRLHGAARRGHLRRVSDELDVRGHGEGADTEVVRAGEVAAQPTTRPGTTTPVSPTR